MYRPLLFITILTGVLAVGFAVVDSGGAALAALYGGMTAGVSALILHWHMIRAARIASPDPGRNLRILFRCAAERLVAAVALLALGLGTFKLAPLPLLAGFICGVAVQVLHTAKTQN